MKATITQLHNHIYSIRGNQVMLDKDLAEMYSVETKTLNRAVKRNIGRFPEKFRFQLTKVEFEFLRYQFGTLNEVKVNLKYQNGTSSDHGGRRSLPYVFTEQGVSMLSAVLRSETAIKVSIQIMDAFVKMRHYLSQNQGLLQRMDHFEFKLQDTDIKVNQLFKALDEKYHKIEEGVFFKGQIFDAYIFVSDLVKSAQQSIVLIDNYIDESVLHLLIKRTKNVKTIIYTQRISPALKLDLEKHNQQYEPIEILTIKSMHDRFLILDDCELYHFGASLKDLGKKCFAFSKMRLKPDIIMKKLLK